MCLALYLFTSDTLPESQWSEASPATWIQRASNEDAGVQDWIQGEERVYSIGSYEGCGCGWAAIDELDDPTDADRKREGRRVLAQLVDSLRAPGSWLVVCWEGDQGGELLEAKRLQSRDVEDPHFEFEELRRYDLG